MGRPMIPKPMKPTRSWLAATRFLESQRTTETVVVWGAVLPPSKFPYKIRCESAPSAVKRARIGYA